MNEGHDGGMSRRDLIRRGVVVGGLAWTAPVIVQSLASPAGAQVSGEPGPTTTTTTNGPQTAPSIVGPSPVSGQPTVTG